MTPTLNVAAGQRAGATLAELSAAQRPTAVFCGNDLLALGELHRQVVFEPELVVGRSSQARPGSAG